MLAADETGLRGLWFDGQKYFARDLSAERIEQNTPALTEAKRWLDIYFAGKDPDFLPPLHPTGSAFRQSVWEILLKIPYGQTITYGDIARQLAAKRGLANMSAQAVGGAVGHNEISVIIPCHRVVGANGSLTGYAGGMPLIDYVIKSSNQWAQTRSTMDETLNFAIKDFKRAENLLWKKDKYSDEELGRATKGAAQAMLLKANLYRADYLRNAGNETEAQKYFAEAAKWGKEVIQSKQYSLWPNYLDNFRLANENGRESVFEIQYTEEATSDYGGEGYTRGTMTTILQRSRSSAFGEAGWGYDRPTQNLYNEYEAGDARRDETILVPTDEQIETPAQEIYCGDRMLNRKYAMYNDGTNGGIYKLAHATRSPKNNIQIRYADVLLMYAEACCESGDLPSAKSALKEVRDRAGLSQFPYTAVIQGQTVTFNDNQEDLRKAIRHERRVELAMEGHRWFDLTRWGIAKETMDTYMAGETEEAKELYGTFQKGKHELFPIPSKEIDLSGIEQNPNW